MTITPEDVTEFWLNTVGPAGWYAVDPDLDDRITKRFGACWALARDGKLEGWRTSPLGALAYLFVTDQFPRNMFRGRPKSFATDTRARAAASAAIARNWDLVIDEPARQFFYLPFMHSEFLADQELGVCLVQTRMPQTGASNLLHARAHREVIRRYSRFPFRNAALGRTSSAGEAAFLAAGGYGAVLRELEAAE